MEKYLSSQQTVILDSMNYIKGFRYELYCLARNAQTTLAVVFCDLPLHVCQDLCDKGGYENAHPPCLFTEYAQRLERPNPTQRWDKPCFFLEALEQKTPCEDISQALFQGQKPRDPVSTKPEELFDANFVSELEKKCQAVVNFISQSGQQMGDTLQGIPECSKAYKVVR